MADFMTVASIGLQAFQGLQQIRSGNQQADAIKAAGRAQMQERQYRADQMRSRAGQERASGQRSAIEQQRKARLAQSTAVARAAAGGGAVSDIASQLSGLGEEGRYSALVSLFESEESARDLESGTNLSLFEGQNEVEASRVAARGAKTQSRLGAMSSFLKAGDSLMDKYAPSRTRIDWNQGGSSYY